ALSAFWAIADAAVVVADAATLGEDEWSRLAASVARAVTAQGVQAPEFLDVASADLVRAVAGDEVAPVAEFEDLLRQVELVQQAEQVALLQVSGGTTGIPKLIPRTHADYLYSVRASVEICGVRSDTRMLVVLPAAHNFAMSSPGVLGVLHAGGCLVLAPDPSPGTAFRLVASERVTMASLVPPLAQAWIASARRRTPDLSS